MRQLQFLFLSIISLTACPSGNAIPFESVGNEWAAAMCEYSVRCELATDKQTCVERNVPYLPENLGKDSLIAKSIAAKSLKYDGAAAFRCLRKLEMSSCGESFGAGYGDDPDCKAIFSGQLNEGATCNVFECRSGLACAIPSTSSPCGGTCKVPVKLGGEAKTYFECEPGLDFRDGKCAPAAKEGEDCGSHCEGGLICSSGKCIKLGGVGEPCGGTGKYCQEGLHCIADKCEKPKKLNETCAIANCQQGLRCDTESKPSICKPLFKEGEICPLSHIECEPTLRCLEESDTSIHYVCKKPAAIGQPCQVRGCEDGSYCDTPSFVCKKAVDVGGDCEPRLDGQCGNNYCVAGKCEAKDIGCN